MRLLVCGDRNWTDYELLQTVLDDFADVHDWKLTLIHGAARGADSMADRWAEDCGFPIERYPADWDHHGKRAGPIRNAVMLATGVDVVIAFHDDLVNSRGTKHMVTIARRAGVRVITISH